MRLAGIDVSIFSPDSVRSASTSAANVLVDTILCTAGWSQEFTFRKFYKKTIDSSGQVGQSLLTAR